MKNPFWQNNQWIKSQIESNQGHNTRSWVSYKHTKTHISSHKIYACNIWVVVVSGREMVWKCDDVFLLVDPVVGDQIIWTSSLVSSMLIHGIIGADTEWSDFALQYKNHIPASSIRDLLIPQMEVTIRPWKGHFKPPKRSLGRTWYLMWACTLSTYKFRSGTFAKAP